MIDPRGLLTLRVFALSLSAHRSSGLSALTVRCVMIASSCPYCMDGLSAGVPLSILTALRCRQSAVEGHRCLEDDEGQPVVSASRTLVGSAHHPLDPRLFRPLPSAHDALPENLGFGSRMATTTVRMPAGRSPRAGRRPLSRCAWFERDDRAMKPRQLASLANEGSHGPPFPSVVISAITLPCFTNQGAHHRLGSS